MAPASNTIQRNLRLLTLFCSTLAVPLLIAITVVAENNRRWASWGYYHSFRAVTAFPFAFIPLVTSLVAAFISVLTQRKKGKQPGPLFGLFDAAAIVCYLATLIPIWAVEVGRLHQVGHALLLGYATAPMIVNLFAHIALCGINMKATYTALKQTLNGTFSNECPHCGHSKATPQPSTTGPSGYSLLRGEVYLDDDETPRQSADLTVEANSADAHADAALKV